MHTYASKLLFIYQARAFQDEDNNFKFATSNSRFLKEAIRIMYEFMAQHLQLHKTVEVSVDSLVAGGWAYSPLVYRLKKMKWWLETLRIRVDCGSNIVLAVDYRGKIIKNNRNTTWRQKRTV